MDRPAEWILQHGWGFHSGLWNPNIFASSQALQIKVSDRGYFDGEAHYPQFSDNSSFKVLVSHSLGLHLLRPEWIEKADALVVIGGFLTFHPNKSAAKKRSEKIIQRMQEELQKDPSALLQRFYASCGLSKNIDVPSNEKLHKKQLSEDLSLLDRSCLHLEPLLRIPKIFLLHGLKDAIVPYAKGCELHEMLPNSTLISFSDGDHALPLTYAEKCFAIINRECA